MSQSAEGPEVYDVRTLIQINSGRHRYNHLLGIYPLFVLGDVDADGKDDFLIRYANGRIQAIAGGKKGELWSRHHPTSVAHTNCLADFDGDGVRDLFVGTKPPSALSGRTGKDLWRAKGKISGWLFSCASVPDQNGDGTPDVLTCSNTSLFLLSGRDGRILWTFHSKGRIRSLFVGKKPGKSGSPVVALGLEKEILLVSPKDGRPIRRLPVHGSVIRVTDVGGDGIFELLVSLHGAGRAAIVRLKDGVPFRSVTAPRFEAMEVADLIGDSTQEFIALENINPSENQLRIAIYDLTTGKLLWNWNLPAKRKKRGRLQRRTFVVADVDGDGRNEIVLLWDNVLYRIQVKTRRPARLWQLGAGVDFARLNSYR